MNKRHLHHTWKFLRKVSYWYFLVLSIVFGFIAINALRQNNLGAVKLRDKVLAVDQANGDIEGALRDLRTYTYSHMNSSLASTTAAYPPIQLKYRYERLVAAEKARVASVNKATVAKDAAAFCATSKQANCVARYNESQAPSTFATEKPIPDSLYKFDFAAPVWSADLAGLSIFLTGFFALLFVVRLGLGFWFASQFKRHA